jgi:uncharacterized membrane protein YraQ (UPF0718 family)
LVDFLGSWLSATWQVLADSALYFLLGLILAGLVWVFLNEKNFRRLLGRNRRAEIFRAALIGVPLPLCSCSVLPVAKQLRSSGLSRGGTVSFLIATPESSIDSILLTYSLTDPLLTVARPVAAFVTAAAAGLVENRFEGEEVGQKAAGETPESRGCSCNCESADPIKPESLLTRMGLGLRHSFTTLLGDLAPYLLFGYLLAGLAAAVFGEPLDFTAGSGLWPYLAALVIGIPLYVCASSSTPLAAVLLGAGFPPGAILVFLMVGPATNLATLTVTRNILGMAPTIRYLASIVVVSLGSGLILDRLYSVMKVDPSYSPGSSLGGLNWFQVSGAVLLGVLILVYSGRRLAGKFSRA